MSTWQEFYQQIRDPSWPDCDSEDQFHTLPAEIQAECQDIFGYVPGSLKKTSKLTNKVFPIATDTACQLKWNWSTLYLATEKTASCHRSDIHSFDTDQFDFHNTPQKISARDRMLNGLWPVNGCNYCKNVEQAGGISDRITNLNFPGIHAPLELDSDPTAVAVTPRILEVYFDNVCNLKCVYCDSGFSSLWDAENQKHGLPAFVKSQNIEQNKAKLFEWLKTNAQHLTVFNILGGEPLYQQELEQCLDFFQAYPAPELKLQMFSNLNAKPAHLQRIVERIKLLIETNCLREFEITASLDCWGAEQEYVRYPLDLHVWETNFEYLLNQHWINLIIGSTVTPLTVKTFPALLERINQWNTVRHIYHYQNSVTRPSHMFIDIFGDIFSDDFARALALKPTDTDEQRSSKTYLAGIAKQAAHTGPNIKEITNLFNFLNSNDHKRGTSWPQVFPWLVDEFAKYNLTL